MKIMTLGKGFASDHLPYEKILDRVPVDDIDIFNILNNYKPDVLVNCIGKTGRPNVDWCETNKTETYLSNVTLPSILASECEKMGIHLIHLGSGCIYFGESPNIQVYSDIEFQGPVGSRRRVDLGWKENDFANPKSFYSKTKYACDLLLGNMANVTTLRLRMPVSSKNDPRNFINKIRGYQQVIDIPNSMTMMDDLVRCIDWAAKESKFGTYHVANPEPLTAAQVMREYKRHVPEHVFEVINEDQLDKLVTAKRSNCILNTQKLNDAGFFMTPSKEALKKCMADYINNI